MILVIKNYKFGLFCVINVDMFQISRGFSINIFSTGRHYPVYTLLHCFRLLISFDWYFNQAAFRCTHQLYATTGKLPENERINGKKKKKTQFCQTVGHGFFFLFVLISALQSENTTDTRLRSESFFVRNLSLGYEWDLFLYRYLPNFPPETVSAPAARSLYA